MENKAHCLNSRVCKGCDNAGRMTQEYLSADKQTESMRSMLRQVSFVGLERIGRSKTLQKAAILDMQCGECLTRRDETFETSRPFGYRRELKAPVLHECLSVFVHSWTAGQKAKQFQPVLSRTTRAERLCSVNLSLVTAHA